MIYQLTEEINSALERMQKEDHIVQNGLRDALFDAVGPLYDVEATFFPLRPSSCLKSARDLFYDLKNFYKPDSIPKAPFEARIKLIFQFGHMTETMLKKLFAYKYGVSFEQERVKYGELVDKEGNIIELTGSLDWCSYIGGKNLILCDAKSIGDYPFKSAPKEANISQMQLYMHSKWARDNNVNSAVLIYFNKNTSDIKCIEFAYEPVLAANLLKRLEMVWEYYKKDELPPREYILGLDWEENYSPYKDYNNKNFTKALNERERLVINEEEFKNLREHVMKYEDAIVQYSDKTIYVIIEKNKLKAEELNESY